MVMGIEKLKQPSNPAGSIEVLTTEFAFAVSDDLNTPVALTVFERALDAGAFDDQSLARIKDMGEVLGLPIHDLTREDDLRIRPASATFNEADIKARLDERKAARAAKDFATSDRIRDELTAAGIEVMDGDPLGWDWKPVLPPN